MRVVPPKVVTSTAAALARLPPLPTIRDLVKLYQLKAIKQLSQNFLLDAKLTSKIVSKAGKVGGTYVCEVGPGPCGITRSLLASGVKKVILIEKDKRFEPLIKLLCAACPGRVEYHWGDVLSFNLSELFPAETKVPWEEFRVPPIHVIGNLPFSVATPLIIKWLKCISERSNVWSYGRVPLTLTFQKEVAERITADAMGKQRCRLSIMSQYLAHCHYKCTIRGSAFVPKPEVDVGVVKFVPRIEPLIKQPFSLVEKVVRQIFHEKSKDIHVGIRTLFPLVLRSQLTLRMLENAGLSEDLLPMNLTVEDYGRLCDAYAQICEEYPVIDYNYRGMRPDDTWEILHGETYGFSNMSKTRMNHLKNMKLKKRIYGPIDSGIEFDYEDDELQQEEKSTDSDDQVASTLGTCLSDDNNDTSRPII